MHAIGSVEAGNSSNGDLVEPTDSPPESNTPSASDPAVLVVEPPSVGYPSVQPSHPAVLLPADDPSVQASEGSTVELSTPPPVLFLESSLTPAVLLPADDPSVQPSEGSTVELSTPPPVLFLESSLTPAVLLPADDPSVQPSEGSTVELSDDPSVQPSEGSTVELSDDPSVQPSEGNMVELSTPPPVLFLESSLTPTVLLPADDPSVQPSEGSTVELSTPPPVLFLESSPTPPVPLSAVVLEADFHHTSSLGISEVDPPSEMVCLPAATSNPCPVLAERFAIDNVPADPIEVPAVVTDPTVTMHRRKTVERLLEIACTLGLYYDLDTLLQYISEAKVQVQPSGPALQVHDSTRTWDQHYAALSFLVNGNLHADYERLSGFLGFPQCSSTQWHRIVEWLEPVVTENGRVVLWSST